MPNLTATQAADLGDSFSDMLGAINDFTANNPDMSDAQRRKIDKYFNKIKHASDDMYALSATLVPDEVSDSLNEISDVTKSIKDTLKHLANVQKGINILGSVVGLAAAVISLDPEAVVSSLASTVEVIKD